ncbi:hypothetical protein AB0M29_41365, partial [Streptomyces sp. NPDC051976]|uniref:hypothetical protein n=1 Tax=Streptomyces sp. NPDC051976 TaxID=3154947 RepID=UPI00341520E6
VIETSDISINSPGASLVAAVNRHPIDGHLEEAHSACGEHHSTFVATGHVPPRPTRVLDVIAEPCQGAQVFGINRLTLQGV